jgi:hypothetical protein
VQARHQFAHRTRGPCMPCPVACAGGPSHRASNPPGALSNRASNCIELPCMPCPVACAGVRFIRASNPRAMCAISGGMRRRAITSRIEPGRPAVKSRIELPMHAMPDDMRRRGINLRIESCRPCMTCMPYSGGGVSITQRPIGLQALQDSTGTFGFYGLRRMRKAVRVEPCRACNLSGRCARGADTFRQSGVGSPSKRMPSDPRAMPAMPEAAPGSSSIVQKKPEACASASTHSTAYLKVENPFCSTPAALELVTSALALSDDGHALRSANALTARELLSSEYAAAESSGGCPPIPERRADILKPGPPECTAKYALSKVVIARDVGQLEWGRLRMCAVRASDFRALQGYPRGSIFQGSRSRSNSDQFVRSGTVHLLYVSGDWCS